MSKYSVFDGLTESLLIQNQEKTLSSAEESRESDCSASELENDIYITAYHQHKDEIAVKDFL